MQKAAYQPYPDIEANPNVTPLAPAHGGHVGLISGDHEGEARFWAKITPVEFVKLLSDRSI